MMVLMMLLETMTKTGTRMTHNGDDATAAGHGDDEATTRTMMVMTAVTADDADT